MANATQQEMWRVKVPKELVNQLDEVKWRKRCSRNHLVERMFKVAIQLWERDEFERMEQRLLGEPGITSSAVQAP
ncbi:MAG: hypothetical protein AAFN77_16830 [Planctomycetota bacterium]